MSTGWNFFFALLIADVAGAVSLWLGLNGKTPWVVGAVVFVVFAILFSINSLIGKRRKAHQAEMEAKLAEAQEAAMNAGETKSE